MEITVPELTLTNLFYTWLVVHFAYGLGTHYLWLARTKAYARDTNDEICPAAFVGLFFLRMICGLEARVAEAVAYYATKVVVGLVTFTNVKPWKRLVIDPARCVKKTCHSRRYN